MRLQSIVSGHDNGVCMNLFNIKDGPCFSQQFELVLFFTQIQIKPVILTICASLAAIGFAALPPQTDKPADKINDALGSILGGSNPG